MIRPDPEGQVLRRHIASAGSDHGMHHFRATDIACMATAKPDEPDTVRRDLVELVRYRIATGYYSTPQALRETAEAMLLSQLEKQ